MMRLPNFRYLAPKTVVEAAAILADHAPGEAMLLAGGTDLLPNMKRRQQTPKVVVALRHVAGLAAITNGRGLTIGAGVTLTALAHDARVQRLVPGLHQAARQVATPHIRNMATFGGNLCLDTRCNYYDQNYEWRQAIGFCMKKEGDTCWVAPGSERCLAVSSTDTAPMAMALGARVTLVSKAAGERIVALGDLYRNDGMHYLTRRPDEILTQVVLDDAAGWRSVYWKLRRRGSFDFPVLSVAAAVKFAADGTVEAARLVLGAVASRPMDCPAAAAALVGGRLADDAVAHAADLAFPLAKPMDNTDFALHWRKRVSKEFVGYALRELRGDDLTATRRKIGRQDAETVSRRTDTACDR
jgi:4-hydroxybenzoyl-CoA reductase subunit beta